MRYIKTTIIALCLACAAQAAYADAGPETTPVVVDAAPVAASADAAPSAPITEAETPKAPTADDVASVGFLEEAYQKAKSGEWAKFIAMILIALTFAIRKWGSTLLSKFKAGKWLVETDRGGVLTVFLLAAIGGISNALYAGGDIDFDLLKTVGHHAVLAMGGFVGIKKLIFGNDKKAEA